MRFAHSDSTAGPRLERVPIRRATCPPTPACGRQAHASIIIQHVRTCATIETYACPHAVSLCMPAKSETNDRYACVHLCTHNFATTYIADVCVNVVLANSKYLLLCVAAANSGLAIISRLLRTQPHRPPMPVIINMKDEHIPKSRNCTHLHTSACIHTQNRHRHRHRHTHTQTPARVKTPT